MVNTIAFLLIVFGIMFLIGIAMAMIVMAVKNIETIVEYALFMRMPSLSRQAA